MIKEERLQKYSMLERHILEAKARALTNEDKEQSTRTKFCENPDSLGIPPGVLLKFRQRIS